MGVIGTVIQMFTDASLLIILLVGLFIVDPYIAILSALIFGVIGLVMFLLMNVRAKRLGELNSELSISSSQKILEVLNSYRELTVRNRRGFYAQEIMKLRLRLADTSAETQFLPNISKYVIESSIIIGGLVIGAQQFLTQDATHAVATLGVFMAASTRIAPAIMRIQQSAIQVKGSLGVATPTLDLIDSLGLDGVDQEISKLPKFDYQDFTGDVSVKNLSLTYPGKKLPALKNINLELKSGSAVAIVGPSGAGKTSLVDAILGVLLPDSGVVEISGMSALESARKWSGAIAYVPQDIMIIDGTISENVVLGYQTAGADEKHIWDALESAQLDSFVRSLPDGLSTLVGERGAKLSGGQRQRLGIARALFTKPKLLVLDEATSSLDGQTESEITASIKKLKGEVTVLLIAHRLSTVREADLVVYMEKGSIIATGSFEHVRSTVPDFDHQAELMGL
jgi:ABC-type multidrug transport system fused ATPase/permease subunit